MKIDKNIVSFIKEHHLLSCSLAYKDKTYSFSAFYIFTEDTKRFIISSKEETLHVKLLKKNPNVSGIIHLETKTVGKIQGLQYVGKIEEANDKEKREYLLAYPYASILNPTYYRIIIKYIKYTDNRLGFGTKLEFGEI